MRTQMKWLFTVGFTASLFFFTPMPGLCAPGEGGTNSNALPNDTNDQDQGIICPIDCGMAVWRVSQPLINLWIHDTPLSYQLSDGSRQELMLSYKHRTEWPDRRSGIGGFGTNWECNWIGVLESSEGEWVTNYVAGGGQVMFRKDGTMEFRSARKLTYTEDFPTGASLTNGLGSVIGTPSGGTNFYHLLWRASDGKTFQLRNEQWDPYGRPTIFEWETVGSGANEKVRLKRLWDKDGGECSFGYTNANPSLITSVTNPYGAVVWFSYEGEKLTKITDTIGMSSTFTYDGLVITNLHTDYGDTSFRYFDRNAGSTFDRAIEVTEANGDKQLFAYRWFGALSNNVEVPHVAGEYANTDINYMDRNSYHWNRKQFQMISAQGLTNYLNMPREDYWKASMKHWLLQEFTDLNLILLSDAASDAAGPVLMAGTNGIRSGQVHFEYPDMPATPGFVGPLKRVIRTVWNGTDYTPGQSKREDVEINEWGEPTSNTHWINGTYLHHDYTYDVDDERVLLNVTGPDGLVAGYEHSPAIGRPVTAITNALNEVTRVTYNNRALPTSVRHPGDLVVSNFYYTTGATGFLAKTIAVGFSTNSFGYDKGNVVVRTNALGLVIEHTWDGLNRLTSTRFPDGTYVSNLWDKLDVIGTQDRLGNWTRYGFNNVRQLVAATNANGGVAEIDYCGCGSPSQIIRWNGITPLITTFHYNLAGQLTNTIYPDLYQIHYTYDDLGRCTNVVDSGGKQLQFTHNENDQVTLLKAGSSGNERVLSANVYDIYGRLTSRTDRNGVTTALDYDELHRLKQRTAQNIWPNSVENFGYGLRGLTNYVDSLGKETFFAHDELGQVLFTTNANLEVIANTYNPIGQLLTLTDGKGQITKWNYDLEGRLTNKVDAATNEVFRFQYDPNGQLTNRWQRGGIVTTLRYDAIGNLTNIVYPNNPAVYYFYDPLNRLTNRTDRFGSTVYKWTIGGLLESEDGPWADDKITHGYTHRVPTSLTLQQPGLADWTQSFGYDNYGRLTNVTSPAGVFGRQYKAINNVTHGDMVGSLVERINLPGGSYVQNGHDDLGRLLYTALQKSNDLTNNYHAYQYNEGHQRTKQTFTRENYQDYTYDNIGQLKTALGKESNGDPRWHEQFGYAYDKAWNLNQRTNNGFVQNFGVNNLNELTTATRPDTNFTVAGNTTTEATAITVNTLPADRYLDHAFVRTNVTLDDGYNTFIAIAENAAGRKDTNIITAYLPETATFEYDVRGNLTNDGRRVFYYDDENQLTSVTISNICHSEFDYDGAMRRRIRREFTWTNSAWLQTNEVTYIYDGLNVIQERHFFPHLAHNNYQIVTYTRESDSGVESALARTAWRTNYTQTSLKHAYYHYDGNGNVTALINSNQILVAQYAYDPFGGIQSLSGPLAEANLIRFSSKEFHTQSGLYAYGFRFYDPNLQRWINRDPSAEEGGINLYGFVGNNPVFWVDLFGLQPHINLENKTQNPEQYQVLQSLNPEPNQFLIVAHARVRTNQPVYVVDEDRNKIPPPLLADMTINHSNWTFGMTIGLYACGAGLGDPSYAEQFRKAMNRALTVKYGSNVTSTVVKSPTWYVWPNKKGPPYVADGILTTTNWLPNLKTKNVQGADGLFQYRFRIFPEKEKE